MRLFLILLLSTLVGCGSTLTLDSESAFKYNISEHAADKSKLKRLVIATVNYNVQSPSYFQSYNKKIDAAVAEYLGENGYEVITGNQFETLWAQGVDKYGAYYDPYSATFRRERFNQILIDTLNVLQKKYNVDGIVFTDLVQHKVSFSPSDPHYASWNGVKRKPSLKGGSGVPQGYNWAKSFRAASLSIVIFRSDKNFIFNSAGGIEVIDNMSLKGSTPAAVKKKVLFDNEKYLDEGIQLAFHPFIKMENYPVE